MEISISFVVLLSFYDSSDREEASRVSTNSSERIKITRSGTPPLSLSLSLSLSSLSSDLVYKSSAARIPLSSSHDEREETCCR